MNTKRSSPSYIKRTTCRLCNSSDVPSVLPLIATPVGDDYVKSKEDLEKQDIFPLELFLCRKCGLAQLLHVVRPDILYAHFTYRTSISLGLVEHFDGYAQKVVEYSKPPQGALAIDIGSNDGTLLQAFKKRGLKVLGIEPASQIAKQATDSGVQTLPEYFSSELAKQVKVAHGVAHVVTSNNTLANIDDLDDIAQGVRTLLAPEGIFVFETGTAIDLIEGSLFDNVYHEHLSYFSVKSLEQFFAKHSLELIEAERISTKGGSMRGIVQHRGGPHRRGNSVNQLAADESRLKIAELAPYQLLAEKLQKTKAELTNSLAALKRAGKKIAGYGASVGSTTFIYHLGLGSYLDVIYDDNPIKDGTLSPGFGIPVRASQALTNEKPDLILILAWRYSKSIINRHQKYLEGGGKFVIPWPEIQGLES